MRKKKKKKLSVRIQACMAAWLFRDHPENPTLPTIALMKPSSYLRALNLATKKSEDKRNHILIPMLSLTYFPAKNRPKSTRKCELS